VIDGCDEILSGAEPERTVAHRLDLIVHSLDGSVGEPDPGPWQNTVQRRPQQAHESLERIEPGSHG